MNTEQERTEFEAWYRLHHGSRDVYGRDVSGEYVDKQVQGAFNAWQARAALTAQPAAATKAPGDEAAVCWSWGPKHYECAVREIERLRAEVERWAQSAHEGWRYAKECDDGRVEKKRRTIAYVCPVCAASLEEKEQQQ